MRFILAHATARNNASQACQTAPQGHVVTIKEPTRQEAASARFHAICSDIAKSGKLFHKHQRTKDEWKLILISAHAAATGLGGEVVAGIEGEFLRIRESSATMSGKRMASLIDYAECWCAGEGIRLSAPD